jgi:hypothetical protein
VGTSGHRSSSKDGRAGAQAIATVIAALEAEYSQCPGANVSHAVRHSKVAHAVRHTTRHGISISATTTAAASTSLAFP